MIRDSEESLRAVRSIFPTSTSTSHKSHEQSAPRARPTDRYQGVFIDDEERYRLRAIVLPESASNCKCDP